jgi:hypothetical protein
MNRRAAAALLVSLLAMAWSASALAYRPFDGTDAAVAAPGELEIELGPAGYVREGAERALIAPAARFNYGFAEGWEAVLEGQAAHGLSADSPRSSLVGNAASLKRVLRTGSLQDKPGPSVATEFGLLLPGVGDEPGLGGSVAGIVSQHWPFLTVHLNVAAAVTRQRHGDVFVGAIIEGPRDWTVRPVAEIFRERDFGRLTTTSALIGAIWQVWEDLSIDRGLRHARVNNRTLDELRVGLTFGFGARR